MKPLIAIAKCDLKNIVTSKLPRNFTMAVESLEFAHLNFDGTVSTYLNSLYGSIQVVKSLEVILILFAIFIGVLVLIPVLMVLDRVRVVEWIYQNVLFRTFCFNYPLRLTLQSWLFILGGSVLNLWLDTDKSSLAWFYFSRFISCTLLLLAFVTQTAWLLMALIPESKLS
jgi:hypothetical protein